jgi:glycosyltransferase involved in cell wall biosynthesis
VRILGLTEGAPDTTLSGVARFLFDALSEHCQIVQRLDYGPHGAVRLGLAAATLRPSRDAWRARFHTSPLAHGVVTRTLEKRLSKVQVDYDLALQVHGWTAGQPRPYALYIDQTRAMAERGYPDWLLLRPRERAGVLAREREMFGAAAHIFTMGAPGRASLIDDYGIAPGRVTVVGGGLNFDRLPDVSELGTGTRGPVVLFVGREFERKGGDDLIAAFSAVRGRVPDAVLHLVGMSREFAVPGVVSHGKIASRERLAELLRTARVFCMPSRYEPYGLALIEAMAHGVPCIGTQVQSIPDILGQGRGGLLVPPRDPSALSKALVRLLTDDQLASEMGRAGRSMVERELTWAEVAKRMAPALMAIARGAR